MRQHLSNAAWSVLDYAAYPAVLLAAAPLLLHHLGLAAYGIWLIANAAAGAGSIVSSGFGDAVIQRVATLRATGDTVAIQRAIRNMLSINLLLGGASSLILWSAVPFVTARITHFDPALRMSCLWSLRIGAVLIVLRSIESVFVSAQRALERFGSAVRINLITRLLATLLCVGLALRGYGVPALMLATSAFVVAGILAQCASLRHLGPGLIKPAFDREQYRELSSFGFFSWLQAISGVIFSQADRLLLGMTLGASAVSCYGICVQIAQPIHGLTAAALQFIFPCLTLRFASTNLSQMRRPILLALAVNILLASILTTAVILLGPALLVRWMEPAIAAQSAALLPVLALGFFFLALNVTGHYVLLARGRVRLVTACNVAGGLVMLAAMKILIHTHGLEGASLARLFYGPITCLFYVPLLHSLRAAFTAPARIAQPALEEA